MISFTDLVDPINTFVKEAMSKPSDRLDLWQESVHAVLFSASFEPFLFLTGAEKHLEYDDFNSLMGQFIEALAEKASSWIEKIFTESLLDDPSVEIGFGDDFFKSLIRHRLNLYFSVALTAMSDRNYGIERARSHSCKSCFSDFIENLWTVALLRGTEPPPSKESLRAYLDYMLEYCEDQAREIHGWTIRGFS